MLSNLLYVAIIAIGLSSVFALREGDYCIITSNGKHGICTFILNCPGALKQIQSQKFPQTCGFAGSVPIVCCTDPVAVTRPSDSTPETTMRTPRKRKPTPSMNVNPYKPNSTGYKSFEKCIEYSNLVTSYEKPPILFVNKVEEEIDTCGFQVRPLVVGGVEADRREFPHMVLIGYDTPEGIQWTCGGTLINELYILTAGHCLISREFGDARYARMGITNRHDTEFRQEIPIIERIVKEEYDPPSYYHDIGLMKLAEPARFDRYVRPACLYYDSKTINQMAVASGWGETNFSGVNSDDLMKVTLQLVDTPSCDLSFKRLPQVRLRNGIDESVQICAGSPGKDTCQGDSGGPLQIYSKIKCMYEVIGVTSFGKPCGKGSKSPGVYTRVSRYVDWIEKIVWP